MDPVMWIVIGAAMVIPGDHHVHHVPKQPVDAFKAQATDAPRPSLQDVDKVNRLAER